MKKAHSDIVQKHYCYYCVLCVCFVVVVVALIGFFNGYIAIYVFSGHGVNHGSCTSDITTVIRHHHLSVSTTIIAREVLAER